MPQFLANKRRELEEIKAALSTTNYEVVSFLAERMYAAGAPFGFPQITQFGSALRKAAQVADKKAAAQALVGYERFLDTVKWRVVEPPVLDSVWRRRRVDLEADLVRLQDAAPNTGTAAAKIPESGSRPLSLKRPAAAPA